MYFRNKGPRKTCLDKCLKSSVSGNPSTDNITNGLKRCCNLNANTFNILINHYEGNYRWKKSLLVINKIVGLFVNALTADDKHYLLNRDNLTQPIQMQLSRKQKNFSIFFFAFLKPILNFTHS